MTVLAGLVQARPSPEPTDGEAPGAGSRLHSADVLAALQAAVYTTDADGRITFYNEAAAELWGCRPELGKSEFCGSWRLYWPDGRLMPHGECPMAVALREGRRLVAEEAVAERPDGTRIPFLAYPTPLRDAAGTLIGAVNMLVDISERKRAEHSAQMLAAIVESSADAIASKDLNGVIASWNRGAEKLFGYSAAEAIGKPVTMLIPEGWHNEEPDILQRIRRGERIEHYETVRRRKDGSPVDVSLSVSPIRDASGTIVGASKIARDISERKRVQEQERLLLREMSHRIKNLFSLAGSIVGISARHASSTEDMARSVRQRLEALALAHELVLPDMRNGNAAAEPATSLGVLLQTMIDPYLDPEEGPRARIEGPDVNVSGRAITGLALLVHEFTTNAAKHGALSKEEGSLSVGWSVAGGELHLTWQEAGGPELAGEPDATGFGSLISDATVAQFGGRITREWREAGLIIQLSVPLDRLAS